MKKMFFIFCSVMAFTACKQNTKPADSTTTTTTATTEEKKETSTIPGQYGVKSGILETESTQPGGATTVKITFDDYGKQRLTEMTMSMNMGGHSMNHSSKTLIKDDYVYTWSDMAKTGSKYKMDLSKLDNKDMDFSKLTEDMKKKLNFKEEGDETIDGKDCKVFSYEMEGRKGKIWMWQQLPLQTEMMVGNETITSKYKSFQENPSLPAGTFDLPAGIEFKEKVLPTRRPADQ